MQTNYSYNANRSSQNNGTFDGATVGFFKLNDGEEALVRFMHEDVSTFETANVHPIKIDNRFPDIDCLRGPKDPIDNCPFCKAGYKLTEKIYIHLIQYTTDANGNVNAEAKVWARPIYYADKLAGYINEYGPLTENLFKIKRTGSGMRDTKYDIMYASPKVYPNDVYPARPELFTNSDGSPYKAYGRMIQKKTFDEMNYFLNTNKFPERSSNTTVPSANTYAERPNLNEPQRPVYGETSYAQPSAQAVPQQNQYREQTSWGNAPQPHPSGVERPRRYY